MAEKSTNTGLQVVLTALLLLSLGACNSTIDPGAVEPGYTYYPLTPGAWRSYAALSIAFLPDGSSDTSRFLLREETGTPDTIGAELIYPLYRYSRPDSLSDWVLDSVWTQRLTPTQAIQTENNEPLVKLVFPVAEGKEWDAHAFSFRESETVRMEQIGEPLLSSGLEFAATLRVIQSELNDPITGQNLRSEVYAQNVGLVEKDVRILDYCTDPDCLGQQEIESGRVLVLSIIAHGIE